ncbi:hypothetical protein JXA32_00435 [Candidatus Sumerlaeota bacterium]|nr:hypothetical protein [Candidatus Sumerlaeota bacterium]
MLAELRFCEALCVQRLQLNDQLNEIIDPFDGQPLRRMPDGRFYSVGPDKTDQQGKILYNPSHGADSAGDIVSQ